MHTAIKNDLVNTNYTHLAFFSDTYSKFKISENYELGTVRVFPGLGGSVLQ
jgi:hypothetical protein